MGGDQEGKRKPLTNESTNRDARKLFLLADQSSRFIIKIRQNVWFSAGMKGPLNGA